ncbi:MAG TPA: hypothetical protein VGQ46_15305 [Thermoanaerobaculia bacterium]|jgi:hypothetical protein|nr:hypothetical protein [Thermoanaerobaculia bacterium]
MIAELAWLILALAAGLPLVLRLSAPPREPSSRVGEALLIGIAICAATLAILPWQRWIVVIAILIIAAAAFRPRPFKVNAGLVILALLTGYALYATLAPPPEYDYLTNWGFKAKAFFEVRGIDWHLLGRSIDRNVHPDYPLLLPLTYDFIAVLRNNWNDAHLGIVHVAFAAALLLVIHGSAMEETRSQLAAAFVAIALIPFAATPWIGLAEGPFIAYATAALLLVRRGDMTVGAILLGLAASTKNEGLTLIAAAAIGLLCAGRKRDVVRLWPAVLIPMPWLIARSVQRLPTDIAADGMIARIAEHVTHPAPLLHALSSVSLGKPLYWIALAIGIAIASRTLLIREGFVLVALLIQFACYLGAYVATPFDVVWHVTWSWERLVAHLTPALTYVVLIALIAPRGVSAPAAQS